MTVSCMKRLFVGTALTVPLAFSTSGVAQAQEANANACAELEQLLESDLPERIRQTEDELAAIIEQNDLEQCRLLSVDIRALQQNQGQAAGAEAQVTETEAATAEVEAQVAETEQTTVRLQDEVVIGGIVRVDTQPPQVDIQGAATEIEVIETQPDVTVREQAGEILVRQASPTIRVDMPTPTITIEQPAPEIIVTMPPPGVDVATARPQVQVRQAEPTVSVSQNPPQVDLQIEAMRAADATEETGIQVQDETGAEIVQGDAAQPIEMADAEVSMTSTEPVVAYQESQGQANVQVERAQPTVRFESAEPTVEFAPAQEPQVQFTQAGEPQVTFQEQPGQQQPQQEPQPVEQEQGQQQEGQLQLQDAEIETAEADVGVVEQTEEVALGATEGVIGRGPMLEREGFEMMAPEAIDVTNLTGTDVYGVNDEEIGEVGDLIMNEQGQVESAVVDVGGFLGLGEKPVLVPFDQMSFLQSEAGELRVYISATEEQLEGMETYAE